MSNLTFYGASSIVTGSSYLLELDGVRIVVDLGMYQEDDKTESNNTKPLPFDVNSIDAVLITHAHLDHCGRLPLLIKEGFTGNIYMTSATKDIVEISLNDSAKIAERKEEEEQIAPIYTQEDVEKVIYKIKVVEYGSELNIGTLKIYFRDAGHILGSASIEIHGNENIVVFSGDLGNTPEDIVRPTETISKADVVVMESTYGGRKHAIEDVYTVLQHEINEIESTNGVLIIPAFSIERTQELIHRIGHLYRNNKISKDTPIYVDSPMAIAVTEVFKKYPDLYNEEIANDTDPFEFETLISTPTSRESKEIYKYENAKVIIAGSGMMNGGRVHYHLKNYASLHNTRILIVGYQAENTLGRQIEEGAREITLFDESIQINATVNKIESMSSHADEPKLLSWLEHIQGVKKVFIVHGEDESRIALEQEIKTKQPTMQVYLPSKGESFTLT